MVKKNSGVSIKFAACICFYFPVAKGGSYLFTLSAVCPTCLCNQHNVNPVVTHVFCMFGSFALPVAQGGLNVLPAKLS